MPTLSGCACYNLPHLCVPVSLSPLPLEFLLGCFLSLCCGCSFIIQSPAACFVLELALGWLEVVVERGFTCEGLLTAVWMLAASCQAWLFPVHPRCIHCWTVTKKVVLDNSRASVLPHLTGVC